jgi:hypothetical protein
MKILLVGDELFNEDGQTATKLIVAFHSIANAPKKIYFQNKFFFILELRELRNI